MSPGTPSPLRKLRPRADRKYSDSLDITPYALCWVLVPCVSFPRSRSHATPPLELTSAFTLSPRSLFPYPAEPTKANVAAQLTIAKGIDVHASAILTFEGLEGTQAIISSSMRQAPPHPIVIQGTKGEITVIGKASNPVGFTFTPKGGETQTFDYPAPEAGDGLVRAPAPVHRPLAR